MKAAVATIVRNGMAQNGADLIVVSNREPYEHIWRRGHLAWQRTDGGLTSALDRALRRLRGVWVAWGSGEADRAAGDVIAVPPDDPSYRLRRVWLCPDDIAGGYVGYANQVLWPLCHLTLDRVEYRRAYWDAYRALNARFADAVLQELRQQPAPVWVHDFHLALLPGLIREQAPDVPVSFFWHVPWPGPDAFRVLPERQAMLTGLLQADSIIFQTPGYARAFIACARQFLDADVGPSGDAAPAGRAIAVNGHRCRVGVRGIGVDVESIATAAQAPRVAQTVAAIRRRLALRPGMRFGLGVDRLDYTKGLLKRLWAIDLFFTRHPEYRGALTFVQIAVPTRRDVETYRRYRKIIWETTIELNDRHTRGLDRQVMREWQPVHLLEERVGFETLIAYYRHADFALVSSVNDGMNLVAKEYVASRVDDDGVLLVSEMAGAAEQLRDAILINPYDTEGLADAIRQALEMPLEERRRRMQALRASVQRQDIHHWVEGCLTDAGFMRRRDAVSTLKEGRP